MTSDQQDAIAADPRTAVEHYAQRRANETGEAWGVYEHVGDYGRPGGDIPARGTFKAQSFTRHPDPSPDWALVACTDPAEENK